MCDDLIINFIVIVVVIFFVIIFLTISNTNEFKQYEIVQQQETENQLQIQQECIHDWVVTSKYNIFLKSYKTYSKCSKCGKEIR